MGSSGWVRVWIHRQKRPPLPLAPLFAGDCCTRSCVDTEWNICSTADYYCVDPNHAPTPPPTAPETTSTLSTPAPTVAWPGCNLGAYPASFIGDSDCDASLNTEECGYDGGELKKKRTCEGRATLLPCHFGKLSVLSPSLAACQSLLILISTSPPPCTQTPLQKGI